MPATEAALAPLAQRYATPRTPDASRSSFYVALPRLPGLVERCLRGEFATADAVTREIRDWRPDFARA